MNVTLEEVGINLQRVCLIYTISAHVKLTISENFLLKNNNYLLNNIYLMLNT